jgi:hypothetical protein
MNSQEALAKYRGTYAYKSLMEKHQLDEEGLWQVRGEDPSCDFGGHHHPPDLGVYAGRLRDVLETAVLLDGFWQWGGGGSISKINIKNPRDAGDRARAEARARQRELIDQQIADLQKKRKDYED